MTESDFIPYSASSIIGAPPCLILAPHPDDEVLGCGGAILAHRQAGNPVDVIVVTDGRLGVTDASLTEDEARKLRARSQSGQHSCSATGNPYSGAIQIAELSAKRRHRRLCDSVRAGGHNSVFVPSPFEIHPDHKALAMAMLTVATRCEQRFELCFYEVGVPLFPNRLLDISNLFALKRGAIQCFVPRSLPFKIT